MCSNQRGSILLEKCHFNAMETLKILGPGCGNCKQLEQLTRKIVEELGLDAKVIEVTDPTTYLDYGVMSTPALVIDEQCLSQGRIPSLSDLKNMIQKHLAKK